MRVLTRAEGCPDVFSVLSLSLEAIFDDRYIHVYLIVR